MSAVDKLGWFVVFTVTADRWLWSFRADGWQLYCGNPAHSSLAILPLEGGSPATLDDARWLADVCAFDHDAPVGIFPAMDGKDPPSPYDPGATPPLQPIHAFDGPWTRWYWDHLSQVYGAAGETRFNGSCVLRYEIDHDAPGTDFSARFAGREELISLYAMAARHAAPSLSTSVYIACWRLRTRATGRLSRRRRCPPSRRSRSATYGSFRTS